MYKPSIYSSFMKLASCIERFPLNIVFFYWIVEQLNIIARTREQHYQCKRRPWEETITYNQATCSCTSFLHKKLITFNFLYIHYSLRKLSISFILDSFVASSIIQHSLADEERRIKRLLKNTSCDAKRKTVEIKLFLYYRLVPRPLLRAENNFYP